VADDLRRSEGNFPEKESKNMTEREITKLASDLYDEGLRAADREKIAEKTDLSEKEFEKVTDLLAYYQQLERLEH
jgi:hypothetical protein